MRPLPLLLAASLFAGRATAQVVEAFPPTEAYKGEARIGLVTSSTNRVSVLAGAAAPAGTGTISGVELLARVTNIGLFVRSLSGDFSQSAQVVGKRFTLQEARLMIGSPMLSIEGGALRRTATSDVTPGASAKQTIWRAGARSQWGIGGSNLQVALAAGGRFANVKSTTAKALKFLGYDAEASLLGQAPRNLPIYAAIGWRYERFDDPWGASLRTEEQSGPFFGIGLRFAAKPELR